MDLQIKHFWLPLVGLALLAGCRPADKPSKKDDKLTEIEIGLLVVDDPGMAATIGGLRAEWKARTGATVVVEQMSTADLIAAESLGAGIDAVVYPSCQLGPLAQRAWIAPLPADYATIQELAWSDTFELLQVVETVWGQSPCAIPFGSPVLTCWYRADLLERFHRRPPQTWKEYHELAQFFARQENAPEGIAADATWFGTIEPLAKGWAGRLLLARAAAYAKHHDHFSTLFKIDTMEPLVAGPAFVRALEELVADAKFGSPNTDQLDPAAVRREFLAGHSALAISWPSHSDAEKNLAAEKPLSIGFAELPGSVQVYNVGAQTWENRPTEESNRVTLLGVAGRLGSVTEQSAHHDQAFQLLAWLSGHDWGSKVSSASPATTLFRPSQMRAAGPWLDQAIDAQAARQYASTVKDALSRQAYLFALRIPGQERYLAELDAAVEQALRGQKSPSDALLAAAAGWRQITTELGIEAQRQAYRKSLGLDP